MTAATGMGVALAALRDVPGVQGSFVVSDLGRLLARDLPSLFGDDVLAEVGPRALRLRETFTSDTALASCTIRYADHLLFLRPLRDGLLLVLAAAGVNLPAVKMGMNLTARRLNTLLMAPATASAAGASPALPPPSPAPQPAVTAPSEAPRRAPRYYRGAPIED